MPMSPRMKARRGRFAGSALLTITVPAPNAAVSYDTPVTVTATAVDGIGTDISANIVWSNDFDSNTVSGASGSFTFASPSAVGSPPVVPPSTITITATVTTQSSTVLVETVVVNAS